ncbi:hypothetical protein [Companilactobacillus furfuricola]|uniref:hypothetical protein n=1 Tax=Companilactobacillus furfuricola TaxID=1462575 RepID=UPI001FE6D67D|nr:hypothetical protein [Companilactobacillus furfuricola]
MGRDSFCRDTTDVQKIIAEMRYYEASSVYGEFPYFVVGTHMDNAGLQKMFLENWEA